MIKLTDSRNNEMCYEYTEVGEFVEYCSERGFGEVWINQELDGSGEAVCRGLSKSVFVTIKFRVLTQKNI